MAIFCGVMSYSGFFTIGVYLLFLSRAMVYSAAGGVNEFYFSISSRPTLGHTQTPIQWVPRALSFRVKRHKTDNSPRTIAEVEKTEIYTSSFPYAFMA
jgi:hypothetical protein